MKLGRGICRWRGAGGLFPRAIAEESKQSSRLGLFVLQFSVGEDSDDKATVVELLERMFPEGRFEIGGGEIFWSGIAPIANRGQPLIGDLGIGGADLVIRGEIVKVDVDLDAAL